MRADVANHGVGLGVDAVAGQFPRRAIIVVHHHIVGVRGEFQQIGRQPVIVAATLFRRHRAMRFVGEMPLADVSGVIAGVAEIMRQRAALARQGNAIAVAAGFGGVHPRLKAGARRTANRLAGDRVVDVRARAGQPVEVGRQVQRVAMNAGRVPALLVGEEDDDVGAFSSHLRVTPDFCRRCNCNRTGHKMTRNRAPQDVPRLSRTG